MSQAISRTVVRDLSNTSLLAERLLTVAWMSIVLGLALESALVLLAAALGDVTDNRPFLADAAQKVSWSMFVCAGLTLGTTASRATRAATMGTLGLLAAPLAFIIAKMIHRAASVGLGLDVAVGPSPVVVALIRALEYGALGLIAGWLSNQSWAGISTFAACGLATGVLFGGPLLVYSVVTAAVMPETAKLLGVVINELVYPMGCAVILFTAWTLGSRLAERSLEFLARTKA